MSILPAAVFLNRHSLLAGVPESAAGFAIAKLAQQSGKPVLHVALHDRMLETLAATCRFFAPDIEIITFPAWDCLPYDRVSPNNTISAARLSTLCNLISTPTPTPRIILTTLNAASQKLPARRVMKECLLLLKPGARVDRDYLIGFLSNNGFRRAAKAMEPGEFAVRGSLLDVISPGAAEGSRLDFFGDTLETIRRFDPLTQISAGHVGELQLMPAHEILVNPDSIERFRNGYRTQFGVVSREDALYEAVSEGRTYPGMEHWLPLFYDGLDTLYDYTPQALVTLDYQIETALKDRAELIEDYYQARLNAPRPKGISLPSYHPLPPHSLYLMPQAWEQVLQDRTVITFSPFANAKQPNVDFGIRQGRNFALVRPAEGKTLFDTLRETVHDAARQKKKVVIHCYSEGSANRLSTMITEHGFSTQPVENVIAIAELSLGAVGVSVLALEHGFESEFLLLLSEQEVLGARIVRSIRKKKKPENFLAEAASFKAGELVVHREHGIGRFEGLITIEAAGAKHDCLKLIYEGDDKLFLPVENIELITRFGAEEEGAKLDKLGGASWQARKSRMKERITMAAEELMKIAAARAVKPAPELHPHTALYDEFCDRFEFSETEDQDRAIAEVLEDLSAGKPMDRLICGDVGFGKTEVAMRAAFAVATAEQGKMQVALICPTTLLARQHYNNFKARFKELPVNIGGLFRLIPARAMRETKAGMKDGSVDIVIGTHALLAKDIAFQNLGLMIVDEEQHFGVKQKEKLKSMKADVHVLTMTATPIPRTLQLAMSGVRDLSLITTPPVDRLAVRTFVMPFDPVVLREAILREYHRGGKTFVVTPRIKDIAELKFTLTELVPEVKIVTAHGQMAAGELDDIMNEFYDGKADVLLSTAIIESGIDIPTANTMIIHRADRFGLSQLYQMRGRVGRSKTRAYAYLTLPHHKTLTEAAMKRLEVMQTLDTLGAGFTLASHDMDIRGFGNLVGEEQSGHVKEVGIELYQQMLEDAIRSQKSEVGNQKTDHQVSEFSPQINLGMSVLIPEIYVSDLSLRMGLYRRVGNLRDATEIESFAAEMIDRFGPLPVEVEHLLAVVRLKQLCLEAGIKRIDAGPKGAVLSFYKDSFAKPDALLAYIARNAKLWKLRADHKLLLMREWKNEKSLLKDVNHQMEEIAKLAA